MFIFSPRYKSEERRAQARKDKKRDEREEVAVLPDTVGECPFYLLPMEIRIK